MATRLYGISAGQDEFAITEGVGQAVAADNIELTVDLANTVVNMNGTDTRSLTKQEVLEALDKIKNHILKGEWPPA